MENMTNYKNVDIQLKSNIKHTYAHQSSLEI